MRAGYLAEGELEREACRVLRKLVLPSAQLSPSPQGAGYGLMMPGRYGLKQRLRISTAVVDAFHRRDWIAPAPDDSKSFTISDAGAGWIRRKLAPDDPFGAQHRIDEQCVIRNPDGTLETLLVNQGESPLGWLYRRKGPDGRPLITEIQFRAGERLRSDFTLAQLNPRLAVDLTAPVVAGRRSARSNEALPETVLAAKQRFTRALKAAGPGLGDLLVDVCCHLTGLEAAERQNGWPQRSARIVLAIALDRLALHYGMTPVVGTGSRIRAWQA